MNKPSKEEIKSLINPILMVWNGIGPDLDLENQEFSNEDAIAMCLDCDFLTSYGEEEAQNHVRGLYKIYGYEAVVKALAEEIHLS